MSAFPSRTRRAATLLLALVALTATAAPAAASSAMGAPTLQAAPSLEPVTPCTRAPDLALGLDTDLRAPSDLPAWSIDAFLAAETPLPRLGAAFKAAERDHGVNALYLLAHAMLETAFGRSYIAQAYNNLFGWTAYDRDPLRFATRFPDFTVSIDYVAAQIASEYLSDTGRFHGGAPSLRAMYRYASDPRWAESIVRIANSICLPAIDPSVVFATSLASTQLRPGETTELTIAASAAGLPNGLLLAARARPDTGEERPPDDPSTFVMTAGISADGSFRLPVEAGSRSGRFALDFLVLDTDGWPLPAGAAIAVPSVILDVVARHAVPDETLPPPTLPPFDVGIPRPLTGLPFE